MIVLDTDHLSILQLANSPAAQRLFDRLNTATEPVTVTIISAEELMRGWLAAIHKERDLNKQIAPYLRLKNLFRFFAAWSVLEWNAIAVKEMENLRSRRLRLGTMDLKIAAITLSHHAQP